MSFGAPDFKNFNMPRVIGWEPKATGCILVSTADLRPCFVDNMKALFHRWEDKTWFDPALPLDGPLAREQRGVFAIVEMEDGSIQEVEPTRVNFGYNHRLFEQHVFGRFGGESHE